MKIRSQYVKKRGKKATSVIPALWRLRQDCVEFQASLGIIKPQRVWGNQDKGLEVKLFPGPGIKAWKFGRSSLVNPASLFDPV